MTGASQPDSGSRGGPVSLVIPVDDPSRVGETRRTAVALADAAGLGETDRGRVALIATEATTNLARHAKGGTIIMRALGAPGTAGAGIEILAVDHGPGIADVGRALEDGFSTGGTPGSGLGAVRRAATEFDLFSTPGRGTVLYARVTTGPAAPGGLDVGAVCVPAPGETACGDGWSVDEAGGGGATIFMVDGLGHGPAAATAADTALQSYRQTADRHRPASVIQAAHGALRATRGAAVAAAYLDTAGRTVRFAGVGNIVASVVGGARPHGMVSSNGTVGMHMRAVREYDYEWPPGSLVLVHSDGLSGRWKLEEYPGLLVRPAATVAAVLFRDHSRGRDDATVVVVRERR